MGLNFAIYESAKSFSESPFFKLTLKGKLSNQNKKNKNENIGSSSSSGLTPPGGEGHLAAVFRKGLCGAIAGGTSKFIVYPLVIFNLQHNDALHFFAVRK